MPRKKMHRGKAGHLKNLNKIERELTISKKRLSSAVNKKTEKEPSLNPEQMCLKWNNYHSNMQSALHSIFLNEKYTDVTLSAEGRSIKCHRIILSSCSSYFQEVLYKVEPYQHPILFMKDVSFYILNAICDFIYAGEVNIDQNKLQELLLVAESLQIKGLVGTSPESPFSMSPPPPARSPQPFVLKPKQKNRPEKPITVKKNAKKVVLKRNKNLTSLNPLNLMEPTYEEPSNVENTSTSSQKLSLSQKKMAPKRIRKRLLSKSPETEEETPVVFKQRKGTKSRPNVKVPLIYEDSADFQANEQNFTQETEDADPLLVSDPIETETVYLEENVMEGNSCYISDDDLHVIEPKSSIIVPTNDIVKEILSLPSLNRVGRDIDNLATFQPVITHIETIDDNEQPETETIYL